MKNSIKLSFLIAITLFGFACGDKQVLEPADAPKEAPPKLGGKYGGGIVVYLDSSNNIHGLVVADYDAGNYVQWAPSSTSIGATSNGIYGGITNTNLIVSYFGTGSYAASLADNYVEDGYSDWYLPSQSELNKIYTTKYLYGGVSGYLNDYYWSSTEVFGSFASVLNISTGATNSLSKTSTKHVRAVRKF